MDLCSVFQGLPESTETSEAVLTGARIEAGMPHLLAKDHAGNACLLLALEPRGGVDNDAVGIVMEHLRVEPRSYCLVELPGERADGEYAILRCAGGDVTLVQYFLRVMQGVLPALPPRVASSDLRLLVTRLVELFTALQVPPQGVVAGLWGELFVALSAPDPIVMLRGWHAQARDRYDFSWGDERLEVKTSSNRKREHHFSFEQANPPNSVCVLVASLFVESDVGGPSLGELWDIARGLVSGDAELTLRVEQTCAQSLGAAWREARTASFDQALAEQSLAIFDISVIPRITPPIPEGVAQIRFVASLEGSPRVTLAKVAGTRVLAQLVGNRR